MVNTTVKLSTVVDVDSNAAILEEICEVLRLIVPDFNVLPVEQAFFDTVRLYEGNYPGYRACTTYYHDLFHAVDTGLAMTRIIHGATQEGNQFGQREIVVAVTAALFHDAGFIQEEGDTEGTGAKYTQTHVPRSAKFLEAYGQKNKWAATEIQAGRAMIMSTDLGVDIQTIDFISENARMLGRMLATVDLVAQMADRMYLEKILFLYHEFKEGNVQGYDCEIDILQKTVGFYDYINYRLTQVLDNVVHFLTTHFQTRWGIDDNLYVAAMDRQKQYLKHILSIPNIDPRDYLTRGGLVSKLRQIYGKNECPNGEHP